MNIEELKQKAAEKGFAVVDVTTNILTDDEVIEIACLSTGIPREDFLKKTNENKYSLTRYLVTNYWLIKKKYNHRTIAKKLNLNRSVIYYCEDIMQDDIKFFKPWQQEAIRSFNKGIDHSILLKKDAA